MIDEVQSTKLSNGIAVLTEHMPGLRSVTAGIWVRRGSRHESPELNGICHFIEHSVFKGTRRRTAREIAVESDQLGGHLDAYTTHEMTGFATKVADTSLSQAVDLLADIVANPRFDQQDLEREQMVILEEMKMVEDTPDELLGELFNAAYFPDHPLGRPIEGTRETVPTFDHKTTLAFHAREFSYNNLVVAAAGNVEHARLLELVGAAFDGCEGVAAKRLQPRIERSPRPASPILVEQKGELEQAHLIVATPGPRHWVRTDMKRAYSHPSWGAELPAGCGKKSAKNVVWLIQWEPAAVLFQILESLQSMPARRHRSLMRSWICR